MTRGQEPGRGAVPITFRVPSGWLPVPPEKVGAPDSVFIAVHERPDDGFTASITACEQPGCAEPEAVAAAALDALRAEGVDVVDVGRERVGSSITQVARLSLRVDGRSLELTQAQVYLSFTDEHSGTGVLLRLVLTATRRRFDALLGDFQYLVWTLGSDRARWRDRG